MDTRRFVVGTAGHIDHGKTALVKALTGVDTDRWEEEKRRGITIDLGFAPLPLPGGIQASVVDVPGHEAFVKNMLAGATGIDVALLVIAADEGIMPQTEEHLAIVELLGVRRGIPVLTKRDLVDDEWLALVRTEVAERLSRSRVRWGLPIAVSALKAEGLEDLKQALVEVATDLADRPADDLIGPQMISSAYQSTVSLRWPARGPSSLDLPGAAPLPRARTCGCYPSIGKSGCVRSRYTARMLIRRVPGGAPRSRWLGSTKTRSSAATSR